MAALMVSSQINVCHMSQLHFLPLIYLDLLGTSGNSLRV
jgi:hypothetical protein